jgi:phosphoglycolate phosphatase-like HAD superfamily hydrolase
MRKYLLFDFDGVIVDSFEACYQAYAEISPNPVSADAYRRFFDGNIFEVKDVAKDQLFEDTESDDMMLHPFNLALIPKLMAARPFDGMVEAVRELGKEYALVVISSSVTSPIEEYLRSHDLFELFDRVYGAEAHKSKEVKMDMMFEEFGATAGECVFITDTLGDMREASKKGVQAIGVSWGFQPVEVLEMGEPAVIVHSPAELVAAVRALN